MAQSIPPSPTPFDLGLYAVQDKVAEDSTLFTARNDGVAWRAFTQGLTDAVNPDEYDLFKVGSFNPRLMLVNRLDVPILIRKASEEL